FFLFKSPKYNQMVKKKRKLISNLKSSKKKGLSQFVLRQPLFFYYAFHTITSKMNFVSFFLSLLKFHVLGNLGYVAGFSAFDKMR
ncbi:MAG: hypothetical protein DRJ02_10565, partial [Bacteroidetes bacterium]